MEASILLLVALQGLANLRQASLLSILQLSLLYFKPSLQLRKVLRTQPYEDGVLDSWSQLASVISFKPSLRLSEVDSREDP